ncbi:MAG: JAB domain-containing protein, partial [Acidiferrobacterales bacterium]|nr:JAB domain-containing protein [Acidiferrobacterales bacterium]
ELAEQISELNAEYQDLSQNMDMLDDKVRSIVPWGESIEDATESEVKMLIGQAMFDPALRDGLERGVLGFQGSTPSQVWESIEREKAKRIKNREQHTKLAREWQQVKLQITDVINQPEAVGQTFFQTVFHGSPHEFTEFSMEKIGTGEGAQAYGYGLYFAENRDVALTYTRSNDLPAIVANAVMQRAKGNKDKAIARLMRPGRGQYTKPIAEAAAEMIRNDTYKREENVYEVEIDDSAIANMLNWDLPLSEQPENVKTALDLAPEFEGMTAGEIYKTLERDPYAIPGYDPSQHDPKTYLPEYLSSHGVPGAKFLDAKSRTTPAQRGQGGFVAGLKELKDKPTRNMVLFSTDPITEVRRNGETVFSRGAAVGTILDEDGNYVGTPSDRESTEVREDQLPAKQGTLDLFGSDALSGKQRKAEAVANYKIRVKHEATKEYSVGLDRVTSADDAAHVLAPIRRNAQENMVALVLDKDQKPIAVVHHAKGTVDATSVYPSVLAGAIHGTEGAHSVWFGHNHPSGHRMPSGADERITKVMHQLMEGTGIEINGHVIIAAGGKGSSLTPDGTFDREVDPTPAPRTKKVPVTERTLRAQSAGKKVTSPGDMKDLIRNAGGDQGVYLLDNRHRALGHRRRRT